MMGNANNYQRRLYIPSPYLFDLLSSGNKKPKKIISLRMAFIIVKTESIIPSLQ